jgi:hypothetical protein
MSKLLFRSCEAADGRKFAFLTDQENVVDCFDSGYKVAYKDRDGSNNSELLAHWKNEFTVLSEPFTLLESSSEIPQELAAAFDSMVATLIKGIDVLFCDYNLGIEGDLPMCNNMMDKYPSTDFVLFSCDSIVGDDPSVQPYIVSYRPPRYDEGKKKALQHRIYCMTDDFAFCKAINAIVMQRNRDNLNGKPIRTDLDSNIAESLVGENDAETALEQFVDIVKKLSGETKLLGAPGLPS